MRNIIEGLLIVSAQASIMVVAVLLLRLFIKKTYKVFTYFMWLVVLLRLCVPIPFESPFGIIGTKEKTAIETPVDVPEYNQGLQENLGMHNTVTVAPEVKPEVKPSVTPQVKPDALPDTTPSVSEKDGLEVTKTKLVLTKEQIVAIVWLVGAMVVATMAAVQVILLRRRVRFAIHVEDNIWETDNINTAFVIGIFRPRIYIPSSLNAKEREHILMHEKMHLRHGDNIVRVVMLLVNVFYWWNPLVWVATYLMKKDMEMFCDEAVIKKMDGATQGAYLKTLLNCSAKNSGIIPVMSFGETNTEVRIRHIMNLKRPKFYIFVALIVFGIIGAVGCVRVARYSEKTATQEPAIKEPEDTTDKVETGEKQSTEADEKPAEQVNVETLYGIYANVEGSNFILIDSKYVSFWNESLYGDSSNIEYEMNCVFPNCEYYEYKISENKIKLIDVDTREEVPFELEIIDNTVIKYMGEEYTFSNKLADSYLMMSTGYPQYDEIINKIVDVNMDGTGDLWSKLEEQNICKLLASSSVLEQCGFYLIDLDGDGIEEMLLGENGEDAYDGVVYEIYSIKDGELIKLCEGGERERYYLCPDNIIYCTGSSGADNTNYEFYEYINGKLVAKTIVIFQGTLDSDVCWYLCDESLDYRTGTPISEAEAEALINMYTYIPIEFTPFATPEF